MIIYISYQNYVPTHEQQLLLQLQLHLYNQKLLQQNSDKYTSIPQMLFPKYHFQIFVAYNNTNICKDQNNIINELFLIIILR